MIKKISLDKYGIISHNRKKVKGSEKTSKILHQKVALKGGLISEKIIWKVAPTIKYPFGIKYRLILVNPITRIMVLLYDNHWPKGPHIHSIDGERSYEFFNEVKLLIDFDLDSETELGKYYEDKKNNN